MATTQMHDLEQCEAAPLARAHKAISNAEQLVRLGSAGKFFEAAMLLEIAVRACAEFQAEASTMACGDRARATEQLGRLRVGLTRVGALMAAAADFHAGWARIAAARATAYGPDGCEIGLPAGLGCGSRCNASG